MEERNDALKQGNHTALDRYVWAAEKMDAAVVVDAGCGYGYGAIYFEDSATAYIGMDVDPHAVAYANLHYGNDVHRVFLCADIAVQSFAHTGVVCLEALSHLHAPHEWIKGLDAHTLVVSMPTIPSKDVYPFRKHEIGEAELHDWLTPRWTICDVFRQTNYITLHAERVMP